MGGGARLAKSELFPRVVFTIDAFQNNVLFIHEL